MTRPSSFVSDPSKAASNHIVVLDFCSLLKTVLPTSHLLSDVCNTHLQLAEPLSPSRNALNDDLLVQKKHKDMITVRSHFSSGSLCPSTGRFTAASAAPGQQKTASLCFHHRQEGKRKLNEVSTEHYVNEKSTFSAISLRHRNTLKHGDSSDAF